MYNIIRILLVCTIVNLKLNAQVNISSKLLGVNISFSKEKIIKPLVTNSSMEAYLVSSASSNFEYTLTVTKDSNVNLTYEDFKKDEYKKSYLQNCNCSIVDSKEKKYLNGITSYQFSTILNNDDQKLYGFVDSIESKGDVYAFVYLTTKENYSIFKNDYYSLLDSINPAHLN